MLKTKIVQKCSKCKGTKQERGYGAFGETEWSWCSPCNGTGYDLNSLVQHYKESIHIGTQDNMKEDLGCLEHVWDYMMDRCRAEEKNFDCMDNIGVSLLSLQGMIKRLKDKLNEEDVS